MNRLLSLRSLWSFKRCEAQIIDFWINFKCLGFFLRILNNGLGFGICRHLMLFVFKCANDALANGYFKQVF